MEPIDSGWGELEYAKKVVSLSPGRAGLGCLALAKGRAGSGTDPLASPSSCLRLAGTASSINFEVWTWGKTSN